MRVLIAITILCFAYVNCETKEEILERVKNECEDAGLGGRYVDPFNCQGYYRCINGDLVKKNCAVGLGYDPKSQECKPKVEGCSISGTPTKVKETKAMEMERITEDCYDFMGRTYIYKNPYNCREYYRCPAGSLIMNSCSGSFDPSIGKCSPKACVNK